MIIRTRPPVGYSAVTPKNVYVNRRRFLATAGGVVVPAWAALAGAKLNVASKSPFSTSEPLTPLKDITSYNNFYEFGTQKNQPAELAKHLQDSRHGRSRSREPSTSRRSTTSIRSLSSLRSRNEFTGTAVWRDGPSWSHGSGSRSMRY